MLSRWPWSSNLPKRHLRWMQPSPLFLPIHMWRVIMPHQILIRAWWVVPLMLRIQSTNHSCQSFTLRLIRFKCFGLNLADASSQSCTNGVESLWLFTVSWVGNLILPVIQPFVHSTIHRPNLPTRSSTLVNRSDRLFNLPSNLVLCHFGHRDVTMTRLLPSHHKVNG